MASLHLGVYLRINGIFDYLCENNGVISFSLIDGQPRVEVLVTFEAYDKTEVQVRSIGATLEAAMSKVPATVERKKKRPSWKRK
jgi:hypothetical protein